MSLRNLFFELGFKGNASPIHEMNNAVNETKETVSAATNEIRVMESAKGSLQRASERTGRFLKDNWKQIAIASAGAAASLEIVGRRQRELTRQTNILAASTDMVSGSVRSMVGELTDHTFSTQDALSAMQRLTRSGYNTEEQFRELLPVFDTFSDATGIHIVDSIDLFDRVLSALGKPLTDAHKHMDTLTWLTTNTTVEINEMAMLMRREAKTLRELGLDVDDVALAMASLHDEGIRGPRAVMGFQDAIKDAEGDVELFWGALSVSEETLRSQISRMEDATGMTQKFADINNDAITTLQKLNSKVERLMHSYGGLFGALDALIVPLLAITPALKILGVIKAAILTPAITGATMATWAFIAPILLATAQLTLIMAAVYGLVKGIKYLWQNWDAITDWISEKWSASVDFIMDKISWLLGGLSGLGSSMWGIGSDMIDGLVGGIRDKYDSAVNTVKSVASGIADRFKGFFGINSPSKLMMEYGVNLTEGLTNGIEKEEPRMDNITQRPLTQQSTRNNTMSFSPTVNVTVSGGDNARGIANELEREFDELMKRYARKLELRNPAITVG